MKNLSDTNSAVRSMPGLVFLAVLFLLTSCATKPAYVGVASLPTRPEPVISLAAGDVIDIKFFFVPELNETQTIRPDGKISLQLVGEVLVEGLTPAEVSTELQKLYSPHLKKSDVTVIVRSYEGRRIYVGGQVRVPGTVLMPGRMTALQAIMSAGGFNMSTAQLSSVVIIRHEAGQRYGAALDLRSALSGSGTREFFLQPQDIVFVPRTRVTRAAQWIDSHINQLIPMLGFEFTHQINSDNAVTLDLTRTRALRGR